MTSETRDGVTSERCAEDPPFWAVWSHRLEKEDATARDHAEPVLLIHAATLARDMFLIPNGGFVKALLNARDGDDKPRFDVLTLDWRSSKRMFGDWGEKAPGVSFDEYRIDKVVEDVRNGVEQAAQRHNGARVRVVAHCLGAAATAQAIATGAVTSDQLSHVVLATIGLFYRLGLDGVLKTAENVMEAIEAKDIHAISPHVVFYPPGRPEKPPLAWPAEFEDMFEMWRKTIFPHGCGIDLCDRLWFMYGGDYRAADMQAIHDSRGRLAEQFGAMPVGLYRHILDNCRRGWAARWRSTAPLGVLDAEPFRDMSLTLVTGSENQVWHRDSIDRMHEWLRRELRGGARNIRKRVFDRYGHVDLWWSDRSNEKAGVFEYLIDTLQRPPP